MAWSGVLNTRVSELEGPKASVSRFGGSRAGTHAWVCGTRARAHTRTDRLSVGSYRELSGKIKLPVALGVDQPLSAGRQVGCRGKLIPWPLPEQLSQKLWEAELRHGVPVHSSIGNRGCVTESCCPAVRGCVGGHGALSLPGQLEETAEAVAHMAACLKLNLCLHPMGRPSALILGPLPTFYLWLWQQTVVSRTRPLWNYPVLSGLC